ncbi:MAG: hypothetical protein RBS84_09840, partial [Kiritimatiellia bacterium]|nr:hypothetical protein [Kiritimatiellia bacterium]
GKVYGEESQKPGMKVLGIAQSRLKSDRRERERERERTDSMPSFHFERHYRHYCRNINCLWQ